MVQPGRTARPTDIAGATDFIGNAIKTSREAKQAALPTSNVDIGITEQTAKSLAELLIETAAEDQDE
jgi:hypothetical protein